MPTYRKRRSGKKTSRKYISRVVRSLAETKVKREDFQDDLDLAGFGDHNTAPISAKNAAGYDGVYVSMLPLGSTIGTGTASSDRVGSDIYVSGVRLEFLYDNSSLTARIPVYITTLVVMSMTQDLPSEKLFAQYGANSRQSKDIPNVYKYEDAHEIHTRPINKERYKVLHRSALRLGCKLEPDLPGPRFAQRVAYIPINKKVSYNNNDNPATPEPGLLANEITPRFWLITLMTNPTQLRQEAATNGLLKFEINSNFYFKDL